ncbi:TUMOR SUPPRESSING SUBTRANSFERABLE CANDIDATE 4 TSSC4 [Salix koriyanagi]|uniref:U5 small nuclear ribonucleoprotein TSSC4 n=1 Tax=Salix koriyanagi TaxID=2511006 RepID=A0A9Q0YUZ6_9ROSI|nr:TUMOR SUPPRESSING SUBTRANSFERABLE CANDIDATE 4 TSSC4 [Salix koriyanagi]
MEDSFRARVEKAFGSLPSSTIQTQQPSSSSLSSPWCLTDEEIQRNQWIRDRKEESHETETQPQPYFDPDKPHDVDFESDEIERDLDDLDDGEEDSRALKLKPEDYNDEEWDIKKSIGLDCTLDYEEEEDHYDKAAVGREKAGDERLYVTAMDDYGIDIDSGNEIPNSFEDVARDPRANHLAAKIRLKEDAEAANKLDSLRVTNDLDSKLRKRVRFDPECKDSNDEEYDGFEDTQMETTDSTEETVLYHLPPDYASGIPDYIQNPSKYTHYTFDSSTGVDEESNRGAYMDFLKMLQQAKTTELHPDDVPVDLSKPLAFIPKKKTGAVTVTDNCVDSKQNRDDASEDFKLKRGVPIRIAAGDDLDTETCAMEEDKPESAANRTSSRRPDRQYRTKAKLET